MLAPAAGPAHECGAGEPVVGSGAEPLASTQPPVWIVSASGAALPRVFGLTGEERLRRALPAGRESFAAALPAGHVDPGAPVVAFRADHVFDARLVHALLAARPCALAARDGCTVAAASGPLARVARALSGAGSELPLVSPDALVPPYTAQLRKRDPALLLPLLPGREREIEAALFAASYKGVTDFVTKHVWPAPALRVVRVLARLGVTPNAVTVASWALVVLATWLFWRGEHGAGLAAAWLMTFLDTVDGKLARVTLRSSRLGHVLDHGLDLVHPPLWYLAFGLSLASPPAWVPLALWITLGGYLVGRGIEGLFLLLFDLEIHCWRPLDSWFRQLTARRNPNLVLLTVFTLAGRPDLGLGAVALWTVASIAFHTVRLLQALGARAQAGALRGWHEEPAAGAAPPAQPSR